MSERTALYRLWDAADGLLYVGVAARPEFRWTQHADDKEWWSHVCRYEVEWHPDRETALLAEKQAIVAEQPLHNITHSGWRAELDPTSGRYRRVPRAGRTRARYFRVDDEKWQAFGKVAEALGADRSKLLNQFLDWYLRRPGAKLPERPAKEFTDALTGEDPRKAPPSAGEPAEE